MADIASGSQQLRAVQLLFSEDFIYFGSDAPLETNHIYRMARDGGEVEKIAAVGSSVFYGCKVGESLFFSTAIEPSTTNRTQFAEVWQSDNGTDWRKIVSLKKDFLPMKYFQYGQILFPNGSGDSMFLYFTPFSLKGHNQTFKIRI